MNTETKGRIEIERTLIVGNARVSEGTGLVFVRFWRDGDEIDEVIEYWMYASVEKITDCAVVFRIPGRSSMWLAPEQVMQITDKDVPSGIVRSLMEGNIVKVIPWIHDMDSEKKCLREFREYVDSNVSDFWMEYHALNEQDTFNIQPEKLKNELTKEFASICADEHLGCSCDGCCYSTKKENGNKACYHCQKREVMVHERNWCQDYEESDEKRKFAYK